MNYKINKKLLKVHDNIGSITDRDWMLSAKGHLLNRKSYKFDKENYEDYLDEIIECPSLLEFFGKK